jgi:maltose alpha-D-glucosyltransferase/alpha-amylase
LPIAFVTDEKFAKNEKILPISISGKDGYIIDATCLEAFRKLVFERILSAEPNDRTRVQYHKSETFQNTVYESSRFLGLEQSNTSIVYNEKFVLKFFRRIYADKNPDYEMSELYERLSINDVPAQIIDWVGLNLFLKIQTIAKRTAEMHIILGSEFEDTAFTPTRFNGDYTVWLKNRLLYQFQNRLNTIENNLHKLDGLALDLAKEFLNNKNIIRKRFVNFDWTKLKGERIRVHGDYHLGQILVKDDDFYILDFEGEPESTIRDRKVKQPPLKDVAGMFRSFHYAIYATIFNNMEKYDQTQEILFQAAEILYSYFTSVFLATYIEAILNANLNIGYNQERNFILKYCLLEKAVYELGYELNSRPRWALIPLKGISNIINH